MTLKIPANSKDLSGLQSVVLQAFNIPPQHWPKVVSDVGEKNFRILRSRGEIVGALGLYESAQWFGGKPVSSAGVACVATRISHRRQGHGRRLMEGVLGEMHERQIALSSLYPSSDGFYEQLGYGHSGERVERILEQVPTMSSENTLEICELDPTDPVDFSEIRRLHLERAQEGNGVFTRNPGLWSRLIRRANSTVRVYGLGPREQLEGWVCAAQLQSGSPFPLLYADIVARSPAAVRTAWLLARLHEPTAGELRWFGSGRDPMCLHLPRSNWKIRHRTSWMLRIVDIKGALEARGYPAGMNGQLVLQLDDPLMAHNSGRWILEVEDGQGRLQPGGTGGLQMGINALGTLYSGYHSAMTLAQMGMIHGDIAAIRTADLLFSGPEPFCPDVY
jgi:predicted acetyltransferase